jgi:hypothetical protein
LQHLFVFGSDAEALRFVQRLVHELKDVAVYRDGPAVWVVDGQKTRASQIVALAKEQR